MRLLQESRRNMHFLRDGVLRGEEEIAIRRASCTEVGRGTRRLPSIKEEYFWELRATVDIYKQNAKLGRKSKKKKKRGEERGKKSLYGN